MIGPQLLLTAIVLSLPAQDSLQAGSISGTVTSADTILAASAALPPARISSVTVEMAGPDGRRERQTSDDAGAYSLTGLAPGVYTLRFTRTDFLPLTLNVRVPAGAAVHVDITLERTPPILQTMRIVARETAPRIPGTQASLGAYRPWRMTGERMRELPALGSPDLIRAIGTSPDAQTGPESGGGIHLQGSSTNHTLLLLDGVPLYNAVHAGDHPSAIDPDGVAEITAYSEPRARNGGRLAGVIEVSTVTALPDSARVVGSIWPTGIRTLTRFPVAAGSALIGVRRNFARRQDGNESEALTLRPSDAFATASFPAAGGSFTGMLFSSTDRISFDAGQSEIAGASTPSNQFNWSSSARALTWHDEEPAEGKALEFRLWQSGTSVRGNWIPSGGGALAMRSRFSQTAASTAVSFGGHGSLTSLGGAVELLRGNYVVQDRSPSKNASLLDLNSSQRVASAFVEHSREIGRLTATLGQRIALAGQKVLFEPRAAFTLPIGRGGRMTAALARTHQHTQSLYNDESVVDAMASLEVPVVSGAAGVPVSSSTSGSIRMHFRPRSGMLINAGTFARSFDALIFPGAGGGGPFASGALISGHGKAYGATIGLDGQFNHVDVQGSYSASFVSREWSGDQTYRPSFAPTQTLLLSAGYRLGEKTLVRASAFMSAVRSTSPIDGPVSWDWHDVLSSQREVSGSPQYAPGAVGTGRLEPYARLDLGMRRTFALGGALRANGSVYANINNVFDRQNALGLMRNSSGSGMRALAMVPRSLSFGLRFSF